MKRSGWLAIAVAVGVITTRAGFAHAQSNQELKLEIQRLERKVSALEAQNQQLQQLDQQVKVIDHKLEIQQVAESDRAKNTPIVDVSQEGFFLKSPDEGKTFNLRIGGYAQTDGRFYLSQTKPTGSEFLMRRVRPILEGTVDQNYDFRIMPDFGQGTTVLFDAYADIHYIPEFRLRLGKFKPPVGLERLQSSPDLKFVERALPSDLVPNRDIGVEIHGDLLQQRMEYEAGIFNQIPDNTATVDTANDDAKDFEARLYFHPFADSQFDSVEKLGLGIAGTYGDTRTTTIDTYKSAGQFTFFQYKTNVVAAGPRYRYSPQFDWYWGPLGLLGEYVQNTQRLAPPVTINKIVFAGTPRTISTQSWQLQASYLLTGEDNTYAAVKPRQNFNPVGGGLGAWELVARADQLLVDNDVYNYGLASKSTAANEAFEWSVGVNWYLNSNVKFQLDYENTTFHYGAGKPTDVRALTAESAIMSRGQFSF
jgi:phosphate-selective porin OprO/OprP